VDEFLCRNDVPERVVFVVFDAAALDVYRKILGCA
jgi:hypothetical protein